MTQRVVLLDTDVFSTLFMTEITSRKTNNESAQQWASVIVGRRVVISFQTRAEVLTGARLAGWGTQRLNKVYCLVNATPTIDVDVDVIDAYATLTAQAKESGHAFNNTKNHVADKWIAACAISKRLPLLTGNVRHFHNAPGLQLIHT